MVNQRFLKIPDQRAILWIAQI